MSVRDAAEWELVLGDSKERVTYSYIYEGPTGIEGYFAFSGGSGQELSLTEFLTVSPSAQRALLGLMRRFHMQTKAISWEAPENDGLWSQVMDREIETTLYPCCIGRVVDVAAALGHLFPEASVRDTIDIEIHDPAAPCNAGKWRVTIEGGAVTTRPATAEPDSSNGHPSLHRRPLRLRVSKARENRGPR